MLIVLLESWPRCRSSDREGELSLLSILLVVVLIRRFFGSFCTAQRRSSADCQENEQIEHQNQNIAEGVSNFLQPGRLRAMDLKKQNDALRNEIAQLKQKLSLVEDQSATNGSASDDQARLAKIFSVFDQDKDGLLAESELQDLALQLGEVIPATEVAACLTEIAPSGKLGLDELHRWWKVPQEYHKDDPSNKHLRLLRLKLQTRPLLELMSNVCSSPAVAPARLPKWPPARANETSRVDISLNMGMFDAVAASARVQLITDIERAKKVRADLGVSSHACVMSGAFILQQECVDAHLKGFKDLITDVLESSRKDMTFSSYSLKETRTESGQRLLWLHVVWENKKELEVVQELVNTIDVRSLDANLGLSQKPGDPNEGFIKARLSIQAEASRWGINYIAAKITEKEDPAFRRVVNLLAGITGVALRLDANDLTKVFPTMVKEAPFSTLQGWASVKPMLAHFLGEELNERSLEAYNTSIAVLSAPHLGYILMEDRFLQASFDNLHIVDVLPTNADFEAAAQARDVEEEEEMMMNKPAAGAVGLDTELDSDPSSDDDEVPMKRTQKKAAAKKKAGGGNPLYDNL